jgi:cellulose synthase/poly-beta-1,6-N-acetylglucosamine synthase-like glycosyltransferase
MFSRSVEVMSTTTFAESVATEPVTSLKFRVAPVTQSISVIIPCYNEERFIGKALEKLAGQYPAEYYEILVVDGMSEDHTREVIAEFQQSYPELSIKIIDNPARTIPNALNLGIGAARGEIIVRIDAHAAPSRGYIRRCVEMLSEGQAAVVGTPCRVQPGAESIRARAIALAVSHPFGIGDAKYRLSESGAVQESVDTVAFACFRKALWSELGGFDEQLPTNEDYDFNYRVRLRGKQILLDRREHCDYFARTKLTSLAAQYLRYGYWKARMIRQRPRSIKMRHTVAPAFVTSLLLLTAAGFWQDIAWTILALELAMYLLAAMVSTYQAVRNKHETFAVMLTMPFAFFTIHLSWGSSFLIGALRCPRLRTNAFL